MPEIEARRGGPAEVFVAFLKLGCTSFGGPIAHLAYFRREFVERRRWLGETEFGELLAICQFLPGPASSQLGFALGQLRAGWLGALAAFTGFTLPSALLLFVLAAALPSLATPAGEAALLGLKIVAFAVVADAVLGMFRTLCPDWPRRMIAALALVALVLAGGSWVQLMVVAGGASAGALLCRMPAQGTGSLGPGNRRTGLALLLVFAVLLFGLPLLAGNGGLFAIADAFYRAGALVFGGGHVVLPLLEGAVVSPGWVTSEGFLAGYGAAQAIPGPLFAFAAYLGALIPSALDPWATATLALAFMFLPGLLLVAGVLPFWRAVSGHASARNAIAGINAAVVGLLAAALYDPIFTSAIRAWPDLLIGLAGFAMLAAWRLPPLLVVAWCVLATMGVAWL